MKFQPDRVSGVNQVTALVPGAVSVNGQAWHQSLVLPWVGDVQVWPVGGLADLTPDHFQALAKLAPELVIFGSGSRLRFPPPACLAPLMQARIGIETMDTGAACRTFNVLVAEGRKVVAALIIGAEGTHP